MILDGITLPYDLEWVDELDWTPVVQDVGYSMTGSLFIQQGVKQTGRLITLEGKDNMAWVSRQTAEALRSLSIIPDHVMLLQLNPETHVDRDPEFREFNVMFRHHEQGLEFISTLHYENFLDRTWFIVKAIRLMVVS